MANTRVILTDSQANEMNKLFHKVSDSANNQTSPEKKAWLHGYAQCLYSISRGYTPTAKDIELMPEFYLTNEQSKKD